MRSSYQRLIIALLLLLPLPGCASTTTLERILAEQETPPGVVIEIVTSDSRGLDWALPRASNDIQRLRQRFPGIPIAIVSHGREQFALQRSKQREAAKVHSLTQTLRKDKVQLHVCGTYAEREGLSKEDFPDYVDVAAAGPAQVNDYLALGYKLLRIKRRDAE